MWRLGDAAERDRIRADKAADKAKRRAALAEWKLERQGLRVGTLANAFVTARMRDNDFAGWHAAIRFARQHGMFDARIIIRPGCYSDQRAPYSVPAHLEAPDTLRVPHGTSIFQGDTVAFGPGDDTVRTVHHTSRVGSELVRKFPYLDSCREQRTGELVGKPHIVVRWRAGPPNASAFHNTRIQERAVVLFMAANPTLDLDIEEEIRTTREALAASKPRYQLDLESGLAARPRDLIKLVREYNPRVLHFSGHGDECGIAMREDGGRVVAVTGHALAQFLEDRGVKLVVLNSCFSDDQATACLNSVRAVVGTAGSLDDEAARQFSSTLYSALGSGLTINDAFRDARDAMGLYGQSDVFRLTGDGDLRVTGPSLVEVDADPTARTH